MSEANGALQTRDPGFFPLEQNITGVPDQRCTAPLRYALHRIRDTRAALALMGSSPAMTAATRHCQPTFQISMLRGGPPPAADGAQPNRMLNFVEQTQFAMSRHGS
jgi:hypothetical protein